MNAPLIPLIVAAGKTPLTAVQRKFNNLVRKSEQTTAVARMRGTIASAI